MVDFYGEDEQNRVVGATEKRQRAQKYSAAAKRSFSSHTKPVSPSIAVAIAFVVSCGLAMLLTEGPIATGLGFSVFPAIDQFLFGPGNPDIAGSPDVNRLIAVLIRGLAIFVAFGIPPLLTQVWQTMLSKQGLNPYIATWMTMVSLALAGYIVFGVL